MLKNLKSKILIFLIILLFICNCLGHANSIGDIDPLPPPKYANICLECAISKRMSVREFNEDPISDEDLSTILWAAYGHRSDGSKTVPKIGVDHSAAIYVFKEDAIYQYNPEDHSLVFYKDGDFRSRVAQYNAPIQIGIVWDSRICEDENLTGVEIGAICQNIQFMATAINLGTVVTAERPSPLDNVSLPSYHIGKIVMPIGHPLRPYRFIYRPYLISFLPRIKHSDMPLSMALQNRKEIDSPSGNLYRSEISQLLWASYGYSYYFDYNINRINQNNLSPIRRHRTVPSAHGYYPLEILFVTSNGVYHYNPGLYNPVYGPPVPWIWSFPVITFIRQIKKGDFRVDVAESTSNEMIKYSPMLIIPVLNIEDTIRWDDLSDPDLAWLWYFEAGAVAHNVILESTAWDLTGNIETFNDIFKVKSTLELNDDFLPLLTISVGK